MKSRRKIAATVTAFALAVLASVPVAPVWCIASDHTRVEAVPGACTAAPHHDAAPAHGHDGAPGLHAGGEMCTDVSLAPAASVVAAAALPPPAPGPAAPVSVTAVPTAPLPPPQEARAVPLSTTTLLI